MAETIKEIPLEELHPFPDHPFGVRDDDTMQQTVESVRELSDNELSCMSRARGYARTTAEV